MKTTRLMALCCFLILSVPIAEAETSGRGAHQDQRIQEATYSADNVFRIYTMKNRLTAIQLEPGETINLDDGAMGLGKPGSKDDPTWIIGANKAGNLIFLKPSQYAEEPETNIIMNTNRRIYMFELKITDNPAKMTYLIRFHYPQPPKPGETPFKGLDMNVNPCDGPHINRKYRKRGDLVLSPAEIWDNGTFTCIRFPTNAPRPMITQLLPDGTETRVNTHEVNDIVVVHSVSKEFRLRLNNLVLALATSADNTGFYNYKGTTTGETLEVKTSGSN